MTFRFGPLGVVGVRPRRWTCRAGVVAAIVSLTGGATAIVGPTPAAFAGTGVWTTSGPRGGGINSVTITPNGATEFVGTESGGLMKSTNAGASWAPSNGGISGGNASSVGAVAIQASSPNTMYMSMDGSVYKSTNGASSWTPSSSGLSSSADGIAIDPTNGSILYAATATGGIFKSVNGGSSWVAADVGLPMNTEYNVVRVDPTTHTTLYAAGDNGIYKSTNSGASWSNSFSGLPFLTSVNDLAIDPANHAILLAATSSGVFRSSNSGASWAAASGGIEGTAFVAFGFGSSAATDYAGGFGGVLKSTNSGSTWTPASSGVPTTVSAAALAIDPVAQADLFLGLTYPAAVFKSTTSAGSWTAASTGINQVASGPLAVLSPTTFLVGTSGAASPLYATTNDGSTFTAGGSGIPSYLGISAFQVLSATKVYALTFGGIYVTTNAGATWTLVPNSNAFPGSSFAVQTNNNSHIDVLVFGSLGEYVETTTNGGTTWVPKHPACFPLFAEAFGSNVLAMEPGSSTSSAVATSAGVFLTTNDWSSCTKAAGTVPLIVNGVSFDPFHPTMVWAWGAGAAKATFGSSFATVSALGADSIDDLWFNPASSGDILAAAGGLGVLQSTNDGSTFPAITNSGLVSTSEFSAVAKAGSTVAATLQNNSVPVINP